MLIGDKPHSTKTVVLCQLNILSVISNKIKNNNLGPPRQKIITFFHFYQRKLILQLFQLIDNASKTCYCEYALSFKVALKPLTGEKETFFTCFLILLFCCFCRFTSAFTYYGIVLLTTEMFQTGIDGCSPHQSKCDQALLCSNRANTAMDTHTWKVSHVRIMHFPTMVEVCAVICQ